jgi:hypothetical protein
VCCIDQLNPHGIAALGSAKLNDSKRSGRAIECLVRGAHTVRSKLEHGTPRDDFAISQPDGVRAPTAAMSPE